MLTYALSFLLFALAVAGLALGVMCGRAPLRGSCGGVGASDGQGCSLCGTGPCTRAEEGKP